MKKFEELTTNELWDLRRQIVLNGHYIADYENDFNFNAHQVSQFFDGYVDYLCELATEKYGHIEDEQFIDILDEFDTIENLKSWFDCFDDLSWITID
jgi:hypothetical protein